jgi:transcriptional/translational regulatory protein YebC/TACO1
MGGGNLAAVNSVSWMFKPQGVILVDKKAKDEDTLMEVVLNAGADDMALEGDEYEIITKIEAFENVRAALERAGITPISAELSKVPDNMVKLEEDKAIKVLRLIDELDELDDAQHVYHNLDVSEEVLEKYAKE